MNAYLKEVFYLLYKALFYPEFTLFFLFVYIFFHTAPSTNAESGTQGGGGVSPPGVFDNKCTTHWKRQTCTKQIELSSHSSRNSCTVAGMRGSALRYKGLRRKLSN